MCDLCKLERLTNVYMDGSKFIILECDSCLVPMVVWKEHTMSISKEYEKMMDNMSHRIGKEFYKENAYFIDKKQRKIFDHLHWHIRSTGSSHYNKS